MNQFISKHSIKIQVGVFLSFIIFVICSVWTLAEAKSTFVTYNSKWVLEVEEKLEDLERAGQGRDLVIVEIRTKLTSIEAILQEIRLDQKKIINNY